jgi:hypothetical protein
MMGVRQQTQALEPKQARTEQTCKQNATTGTTVAAKGL